MLFTCPNQVLNISGYSFRTIFACWHLASLWHLCKQFWLSLYNYYMIVASSNILIHVPSLFFVSYFSNILLMVILKHTIEFVTQSAQKQAFSYKFISMLHHVSGFLRKLRIKMRDLDFLNFVEESFATSRGILQFHHYLVFIQVRMIFFMLARNLSVFSENLLWNSLALKKKKKSDSHVISLQLDTEK